MLVTVQTESSKSAVVRRHLTKQLKETTNLRAQNNSVNKGSEEKLILMVYLSERLGYFCLYKLSNLILSESAFIECNRSDDDVKNNTSKSETFSDDPDDMDA